MANPRQRRKSRSGSSTTPSARAKRASQKKLVRVPTIKGAQVIQENWDPKLTVRQNYQKLGLLGDLSMRDSGGKEKGQRLAALPESVRGKKGIKGSGAAMARVERDAEGNLVIVEEEKKTANGGHSSETAWGPALNRDDDDDDDNDEEEEDEDEDQDDDEEEEEEEVEKNTEVTDTLEALSKTIKPVPRFTSQAEKSWLHRLVAKHGEDTTAMARDRVDNVWQRTEGEIKRAIKKAGGLGALQV